MTTVNIAFIDPVSPNGMDNATFAAVETINSTTSNQVTTITSTGRQTAVITAIGGDVWVAFGASPNATTVGTRRLIASGSTRAFANMPPGTKVAVVDFV